MIEPKLTKEEKDKLAMRSDSFDDILMAVEEILLERRIAEPPAIHCGNGPVTLEILDAAFEIINKYGRCELCNAQHTSMFNIISGVLALLNVKVEVPAGLIWKRPDS